MFAKPHEQRLKQGLGIATHRHDGRIAVHVGEEKLFDAALGCGHGGREGHHGARLRTYQSDAVDVMFAQPRGAGHQHILDEPGYDAAAQFMDAARRGKAGMKPRDLCQKLGQKWHNGKIIEGEQPGTQAIIKVMGIVGNIVGQSRRLRLGAGKMAKIKRKKGIKFENVSGNGASWRASGRMLAKKRAIVFGHALKGFKCQVEPVKAGVAMFQLGDEAQSLGVVIKAALPGHDPMQGILASMTERRMSQIMGKSNGLGEIIIEFQAARQSPRDLRNFDRVGQSRAEVVALEGHEHLAFMRKAAKCRGMNDPVTIPLKGAAGRRIGLGDQTAAAGPGVTGIGGKVI